MADQTAVKRKVVFIGQTKDGDYAAHKELELTDDKENVFKIPHVITENGYVNVTIQLDGDGRLLALAVAREDHTAV
jgi:hypothetical protein